MAVSKYMTNMAAMEMLATFCMRFLLGLMHHKRQNICIYLAKKHAVCSKQYINPITEHVQHLLFEFCVDGQHFGVTHKGKRYNGNGKSSLQQNQEINR